MDIPGQFEIVEGDDPYSEDQTLQGGQQSDFCDFCEKTWELLVGLVMNWLLLAKVRNVLGVLMLSLVLPQRQGMMHTPGCFQRGSLTPSRRHVITSVASFIIA